MHCRKARTWNRTGGVVQTIRTAVAIAFVVAIAAMGQIARAQCNPQETYKLLASDGEALDQFGYWGVAVDGTTAIVGAAFDDAHDINSGSAYLFDTVTGAETFKLLPPSGDVGDKFGVAVGISATTAIVGASDEFVSGADSGSAYLFDTSTGTQTAWLIPSDGANGDDFGYAVAVSGNTAIVGAWADDDNGNSSGSAYIFDAVTGTQIYKFVPGDNAAGDNFGTSVAINGNTAIIGASSDDDNGTDSGSAYLFDSVTGTQTHKLLPGDGAAGDSFGISVAISGNTAIIGAPTDDDNGSSSGSAYLFDTTTGDQIAKLLPNDGAASDLFGMSVAISDTTAIVGAIYDDDNGSNSGSAYLFDATTGAQLAKLIASDGEEQDAFGNKVAIDDTTAMVGSSSNDFGNSSGAAYLFDTGCASTSTISADYNCLPASGTVPFSTLMTATLNNDYAGQIRRIAARINATIASGTNFNNWKAGWTNVSAGGSSASAWNQTIPALGTVIGTNVFSLVAEDVTPSPYNQPPHPPAGDTATASCTVIGISP